MTNPEPSDRGALADARHLQLIHGRWVTLGPYAYPFCWVVPCKCSHGIGAR